MALRVGLHLDLHWSLIRERGDVADPQAVGQVVHERELAVFSPYLLDTRALGGEPQFPGHHPR
jgi:hypothetical protein